MQQADVVLYDNLVAPEIDRADPPRRRPIYVGKRASQHTCREDINSLLVRLAKEASAWCASRAATFIHVWPGRRRNRNPGRTRHPV